MGPKGAFPSLLSRVRIHPPQSESPWHVTTAMHTTHKSSNQSMIQQQTSHYSLQIDHFYLLFPILPSNKSRSPESFFHKV